MGLLFLFTKTQDMPQKILADIHTHILPGVDDGARNTDIAINMLKREAGMGTRLIVLTPHYVCGRSRCDAAELRLKYENLKHEPEVETLRLTLVLGNELFYSPELLSRLTDGSALTIGDTIAVLLEFPVNGSAKSITEGCRTIYNGGYRVILAHIERYQNLDDEAVETLLNMNVSFQMNASYAKGLLKPVLGRRRWHKNLLREGLISYIASDAHDMNDRAPRLYAEEIGKAFPEYAEAMLYRNAEKLLRGS